jgi:hypothetical protein
MKTIDPNKIIVFDADVIIHFIKSEFISILPKLYPQNQKVVLDKLLVEDGVLRGINSTEFINMVRFKIIKEIPFPQKREYYLEYANLVKRFGKGESACLAYVRLTSNVIASSNLRDIKDYCEVYQIEYLTTMDLLEYAHQNGILSEADCDFFIYNVKSKDSRLPFNTMREFYSSR